jgi:nitronate monooxygenase
MKLVTALSARLGLAAPIVQAPMAGGPSSPELVAACSAAGALGSFGFAYTQPEEMKKQCAWVRGKTDGPFGINLFTSPQPAPIDPAAQRAALAAVAGYYQELGLPPPEPVNAPYVPDLGAQLDAVAEIRPRVFTVHLNDLEKERIKAFQSLGILVGGSATCVAEAKRLEQLGFDFVVAQGGEAGGHRGSYLRDPYQSLAGTLALVRLVARAVKLPVVAAGGIMDGEGVAAALALGAELAQLGTAFIPCPESGAPQIHKDLLLASTEDSTRLTEKFSGKPARGLANRFIEEMAAKNAPQLAFPAQNAVTGRLRQASAKAGRGDFVALWAGQAAPLSRALPAAELIARLESEAIASIRKLKGMIHEP